jgi:hypothetical protein
MGPNNAGLKQKHGQVTRCLFKRKLAELLVLQGLGEVAELLVLQGLGEVAALLVLQGLGEVRHCLERIARSAEAFSL